MLCVPSVKFSKVEVDSTTVNSRNIKVQHSRRNTNRAVSRRYLDGRITIVVGECDNMDLKRRLIISWRSRTTVQAFTTL
jgi:hypothetical protein